MTLKDLQFWKASAVDIHRIFFMFEANRDKRLTILFPFIRHELLVSVKAK